MTATPPTTSTAAPRTLARYESDTGTRLLIGQRVDGHVRITDRPAHGPGRRFLVEDRLESTAALQALIADYLAKAKRLGYPPMHGWF